MSNFFNTLRKYFAPPVFEGDEEKNTKAYLLNFITITYLLIAVVTVMGALSANAGTIEQTMRQALTRSLPMVVIMVGAQILMRSGRVTGATIFFSVFLWLQQTYDVFTNGGVSSPTLFMYILMVMLIGLLIGRQYAIVAAIASFVMAIIVLVIENQGLLPAPLTEQSATNSLFTFFFVILLSTSLLYLYGGKINEATQKMLDANLALEQAGAQLERRVAERTKALETSAEISRRLTSILDPRDLAKAVVTEVQSVYDYYYAQIYLFDDARENLVLTSGTGGAGAQMMKRGHSLPKGRGLVGRAAENNESILVSDTSQDPDWLPNELLPDTKAEAVVPISIGDQVFGVLDVQDDVTNDITPEDITLLESLAGQVAISLQNAESYARAEAALQEAKSLVENAAEGIAILDLETELWAEPNENFSRTFGMTPEEMVQTGPKVMSPSIQPDGRDSVEKAIEMINTAMEKGSHRFEWVHTKKDGSKFDCEIGLVRLPGDRPRLRQSILDITERKQLEKLTATRARQQEAINTITQRIQAASTVEEAMQVAARELGHALGQKQTVVALEASALGGNGNTSGNK